MTQDEIIRMAREACAPNQTFNSDEEWVKRFYELAYATGAAHEREACAKVCEEIAPWGNSADDWAASCLNKSAKAIRARGNEK